LKLIRLEPFCGCSQRVLLITNRGRKTEAALILAHRLIAAGRASGLYVGLPTMATANGLYARLGLAYRNLFTEGAHPSLVLAHAGAVIDPTFRQSVLAYDADDGAAAQCSAWLADNRRAAFLAQVGVGTVDQAILAILASTHQSLRLTGLAQRVLVIDEAHAYDAYMGQEIVRLLEAHAQLGGSAIVLSATLPHDLRSRLIAAYRGHLPEPSPSYPLATVQCVGNAVTETPVEPRPENVRSVSVRFVGTVGEGDLIALEAARSGQGPHMIRWSCSTPASHRPTAGTAKLRLWRLSDG
jgi:CRISPR-associated endonuclease/helicase Cas3